jgi:hypothetical protein
MAQKAFDRAKVKVKACEDQLTPLEIAKLLEKRSELAVFDRSLAKEWTKTGWLYPRGMG